LSARDEQRVYTHEGDVDPVMALLPKLAENGIIIWNAMEVGDTSATLAERINQNPEFKKNFEFPLDTPFARTDMRTIIIKRKIPVLTRIRRFFGGKNVVGNVFWHII